MSASRFPLQHSSSDQRLRSSIAIPQPRPKSAQQQTAMTDKQSNKVDMYNAVGLFYTTNQTVIDTVNARVTAFGRLNTNRTALASAIGGQSIKTSGPQRTINS
jgi:hypothetical protein